jgi:tRNA (adenine22-N1)-methyltransferase
MQLSKRLQAVADLITPGSIAADVGCDHAFTSIYLAEQKISPKIIAMDVNQGPIDRAKENIHKYGFQDQIEVRKSDGLEKLNQGEADSIIIAGMGGALINQILSERMEVVESVRELILQPQSEIHKVRQMLCDIHFIITGENMIKEDGKYYVMMKAEPEYSVKDRKAYLPAQKEHFYYGRLLLEQKHPVLKEFLLWDLKICNDIMNQLDEGQKEASLLRREEIRERMDLIKRGLCYFE